MIQVYKTEAIFTGLANWTNFKHWNITVFHRAVNRTLQLQDLQIPMISWRLALI